MELMNPMVMPKAPEVPRTSSRSRVDNAEAEESTVSFPTMLQQQNRPEKAGDDVPTTQTPAGGAEAANEGQAQSENATGTAAVPAAEGAEQSGPVAVTGHTEQAILLAGALPEASRSQLENQAAATTAVIGAGIRVGAEVPQTPTTAHTPGTQAQTETPGAQPETPATPAEGAAIKEASQLISNPKMSGPELTANQKPDPTPPTSGAPVISEEGIEEGEETASIQQTPRLPGLDLSPAAEQTTKQGVQQAESQNSQPEAVSQENATAPAASSVDAAAVSQAQNQAQTQAAPIQSEVAPEALSQIHKAMDSYTQPQVTVTEQAAPQPTLADLNLDSGSLDSFGSRESLLTRLAGGANGRTQTIKRAIQAQVSQRVADHLKTELGKEQLTIRLNPDQLGQVEVRFEAVGDQLSVVMNAEGRQAEHALQEGARELAETIGDKSSRFQVVDVRIETRGSETQRQDSRQEERRERDQQGTGQQREQHQGHGHQNAPKHQTGADEWAAYHLGG